MRARLSKASEGSNLSEQKVLVFVLTIARSIEEAKQDRESIGFNSCA